MSKAIDRLLWVLAKFEIEPPKEHVHQIINNYPSLDWSIEAIHIYAWVLHRQNWNIINWQQKINLWGKRTKRDSPFLSRDPNFEKCRKEIEDLDIDSSPDWVVENTEEEALYFPENKEEILAYHGQDSEHYQYVKSCFDVLDGLDLSDRLRKLEKWIGWKKHAGISHQDSEVFDRLMIGINNGWFDDENLMLFLACNNFEIESYVRYTKDLRTNKVLTKKEMLTQPKEEVLVDPRPEEDETFCVIDGQKYETLYLVACKVEGCRLPLLGRVLAEENGKIFVRLIAPINGEDKYWLTKSLCRIIENNLETQKGNITKEQIDESISKMVGE